MSFIAYQIKISGAKDHGKNYIKVRPPLVRHLALSSIICNNYSPPQSFQRRKKGKKGKNEALLHNLSRSGQVGPQVAFLQIIITG